MELSGPIDITSKMSSVESVGPGSQDLFEAMAKQAREMQFTDLGQVGDALAEYLDNYLERTTLFSDRVSQLSAGEPADQGGFGVQPLETLPTDPRVMTVLQSLSAMFDYSIETQVVVRSATQISGAINTLLKGQ